MTNIVTKAVIIAAGYGTRFLPATKVVPKEMFPIIDKPILQYLVEEAVESGIKELIIVTRGQEAIQKHFAKSPQLEKQLAKAGKKEILNSLKHLVKMAKYTFIKQDESLPYGNATPLISINHLIKRGERFVYMFGDDLVLGKTPCTKQIIGYSNKKGGAACAAVQQVPKSEVNRYGIYQLAKDGDHRVISAVEKPDPNSVKPPYLSQFGRFILNKEIIDITSQKHKKKTFGKNGELWIIDSIVEYAKNNPVYTAKIKGEWLTTGDPLRYMKTQVKYMLKRKDLGPDFLKFLKSLNL